MLRGIKMVIKKLHHTVTRPGRMIVDEDVEIKVAEELATVPGIPKLDSDVDFYSRFRPAHTHGVNWTFCRISSRRSLRSLCF